MWEESASDWAAARPPLCLSLPHPDVTSVTWEPPSNVHGVNGHYLVFLVLCKALSGCRRKLTEAHTTPNSDSL